MVELTPEQRAAYQGALAHVAEARARREYYSIHALAGCGKTVVLAELAKVLPNAIPCTFTAKAASVLRRRGVDARTIHSAIYDFNGEHEDEETGRRVPVFSPKGETLERTTFLLDEDSMIGTRIAADLRATGARLISTGDPGQIGPVGDHPYFTDTAAKLRTIHRQAQDSAVIRQAYEVRIRGRYAPDGDDFRVTRKTTADDRVAASVALCWKNSTRKIYNRVRRSDAGLPSRSLRTGEPVMCTRNNYRLGVFNGVIYTVARDWLPGEELQLREDLTDRLIAIADPHVEDFSPERDRDDFSDETVPLAPAYAVTIHKSQGSEWDNVILIDEYPVHRDDWRQLTYTAITRAAKSVLVVNRG